MTVDYWVSPVSNEFMFIDEDGEEFDMMCPVCRSGREQAQCRECAGRGRVDNVPYCENGWDEILPGLFVGGHQCHPKNGWPGTMGDVIVRDEFDLVVSLYDGGIWYGPSKGRSVRHQMVDGVLEADHHEAIHRLADEVVTALGLKQKVLVRCWAGLNRSSLVTALAMIKMGWKPEDAIVQIRDARSPYALFNESFVAYLKGQKA